MRTLASLLCALLLTGCVQDAPQVTTDPDLEPDASTSDAATGDAGEILDTGGPIDSGGAADAGNDAAAPTGTLSVVVPERVEVGVSYDLETVFTPPGGMAQRVFEVRYVIDGPAEVRGSGAVLATGTGSIEVQAEYEGLTATGSTVSEFDIAGITVGNDNACLLTTGGRVWCWGSNDYGQVGVGSEQNVELAMKMIDPAPFDGPVAEVECGEHACVARTESGQLYSWGVGWDSRLGYPSTEERVPRAIPMGPLRATQISIEKGHACAVLDNSRLACWGRNPRSQLLGVTGDRSAFGLSGGQFDRFRSVAVGEEVTCGVPANIDELRCWGDGRWITGVAGADDVLTPTAIAMPTGGNLAPSRYDLGRSHGCGLVGSDVFCWGDSGSGGLGAPLAQVEPPREMPDQGFLSFDDVHVSTDMTFVRDSSGTWYAVGNYCKGEQATGSDSAPRALTPLDFVGDIALFDSGPCNSCLVDGDGKVWCAGAADTGILGVGGVEDAYSPVTVQFPWEQN